MVTQILICGGRKVFFYAIYVIFFNWCKITKRELKKIDLKFTEYEIDLIIKCLSLGYRSFDRELMLFNNKIVDKERILGCKANKCFHNIDNNDFLE